MKSRHSSGIGEKVILISCLLMMGVFFLRQAVITYNNTIQYGGTDLRVRIVGSRLMQNGLDPFFMRWQPGMPLRLCDPNDDRLLPVNGVTVTPFVLWLQQPLAHLGYSTIRIAWWVIQQLLLAGILCLVVFIYRKQWAAIAAMSICFGVLCNQTAWFYHAERGQIYILYAAWVAILFGLWQSRFRKNFWVMAGWLAAGILLRPLLIVFALPAFIDTDNHKKIKLITACIGTITVLIFISNSGKQWLQYLTALRVYNRLAVVSGTNQSIVPSYPQIIEGVANLTLYKQHPPVNYLLPLSYYFEKMHLQPGLFTYGLIFIFIATVLIIALYRQTKWKLYPEQLLMLGILLYVLAELCQPFRIAYNLVMWLPAALVMSAWGTHYRFSGKLCGIAHISSHVHLFTSSTVLLFYVHNYFCI